MTKSRNQEPKDAPDGAGAGDPNSGDAARVTAIVEGVVRSDGEVPPASDRDLYAEIEALAHFIEAVRQEVATLKPGQAVGRHLPQAVDELGAIVGATEQATHGICAAAEAIEGLAPQMTGDLAARITAEVTRIYEACSFQDLTGQRIGRVVAALLYAEDKIHDLLRALGDTDVGPARRPSKAPGSDAHMLLGPQRPGKAKSQAEVDALMASPE